MNLRVRIKKNYIFQYFFYKALLDCEIVIKYFISIIYIVYFLLAADL